MSVTTRIPSGNLTSSEGRDGRQEKRSPNHRSCVFRQESARRESRCRTRRPEEAQESPRRDCQAQSEEVSKPNTNKDADIQRPCFVMQRGKGYGWTRRGARRTARPNRGARQNTPKACEANGELKERAVPHRQRERRCSPCQALNTARSRGDRRRKARILGREYIYPQPSSGRNVFA